MTRFSVCLLAAMALTAAWCGAARAQMVQVAPGYVRAPFVRVYTGPGGTYVRAPFTAVRTPGFGARIPGPQQLAQMDWRTLRQVLREISEDLDEDLSDLSTGNSWKVFLKTAEIRALADDSDRPPSPDTVDQLQQILKAYDKTNANETYRNIAGQESFQGTYHALVEFSAPPEQRTRRQLVAAAAELNRQLERIGADPSWQRHLALPDSILADPSRGSAPNPAELEKVLVRYDAVSKSDQYQAVARLATFQATHKRLAEYVELFKGPAPGPPAPVEELPTPAPAR